MTVGRAAVVTGAGRGIGQGIAARLADDGYAVAIADVDAANAHQTAVSIRGHGGTAKAFAMDVADGNDVRRVFAEIDVELGPPAVLVNCAGVFSSELVVDLTEEEWDRVMAVNLKGTFLCSQVATRSMLKAGPPGRIVNIASEVGKTPQPRVSHYAASKAGVIAFTKALALEVAASGITVNCICPTLTDTQMIAEYAEDLARLRGGTANEWRQSFDRRVPVGRMARPEDIAAVVSFLVRDEAAFVTGAAYNVTGGRELH